MSAIHQFAIEPELISQWPYFQLLWEDFGAQQGRWIAEYPAGWRKKVKNLALKSDKHGPIRASAIADRILQDRLKIVSCQEPYDPPTTWQKNCDPNPAFKCILVEQKEPGTSRPIPIADLDKSVSPYLVQRQFEINRSNEEIAELFRSLVTHSDKLVMIDPYYSSGDTRWTNTITLILEKYPWLKEIHIHCSPNIFEPAVQIRHAERHLLPYLPAGCTIKINHWKQKQGGQLPHGRFVLTDRGGIQLDPGLDSGHSGEKTQWTLMDHNFYIETQSKFDPTKPAFDLHIDGTIVIQG